MLLQLHGCSTLQLSTFLLYLSLIAAPPQHVRLKCTNDHDRCTLTGPILCPTSVQKPVCLVTILAAWQPAAGVTGSHVICKVQCRLLSRLSCSSRSPVMFSKWIRDNDRRTLRRAPQEARPPVLPAMQPCAARACWPTGRPKKLPIGPQLSCAAGRGPSALYQWRGIIC